MLRGMAVGLALLMTIGALASCSSKGVDLVDPNSGQIAGDIAIVGPFDPAQQLRMDLLFFETGTVVDQSELPVGKVPGVAAAYFAGRSIHFSYSQLFIGVYVVEVFSGTGAARDIWYRGLPVQVGVNGVVAPNNGAFSFTGVGPYGHVAGEVALTGTWPAVSTVFLGFTRVGGDGTLLRWPVDEADVLAGVLPYSVDGLSFGDYELGLYSVDAAGVVTGHGALAALLKPRQASPDVPDQDFTADFS